MWRAPSTNSSPSSRASGSFVAEPIAAPSAPASDLVTSRWVLSIARDHRTASPVQIVGANDSSPSVSSRNGCTVVFDGVLHNRLEIAARLDVDGRISDAEILAAAYRRWALDLPRHIDAAGALIVFDANENRTVAVRDPLGAFPLFYTESAGRLMFSTSIDALRRQPGVDRSFNRPALVDHLCHSWTDPHETFFAAIRRVPRGQLLVSNGRETTVTRYWEPVPPGQPVKWIADDELQPRFEAAFEIAVERAVAQGPTGIFLSGGLDSISVAAMAADVTRRDGRPLPRPFSL